MLQKYASDISYLTLSNKTGGDFILFWAYTSNSIYTPDYFNVYVLDGSIEVLIGQVIYHSSLSKFNFDTSANPSYVFEDNTEYIFMAKSVNDDFEYPSAESVSGVSYSIGPTVQDDIVTISI